jgi:hypothetical protein
MVGNEVQKFCGSAVLQLGSHAVVQSCSLAVMGFLGFIAQSAYGIVENAANSTPCPRQLGTTAHEEDTGKIFPLPRQ